MQNDLNPFQPQPIERPARKLTVKSGLLFFCIFVAVEFLIIRFFR